MFSKRTPLFLRPNLDYRMLKLLPLFAALILTLLYTSLTVSSIIYPQLAEAEAASSIVVYSPSTYSYPSLASVDEKPEIPRRNVILERDVVESAIAPEIFSSDDSNNNTDYPDSDLTDSSSTPPRPSRTNSLCLLAIYRLITHSPTHLIDNYLKPTISHTTDRLPASLILVSQRLAAIYHRLSAYLPNVSRVPSAILPTPLITSFKSRRKFGRRRGPGHPSFRVGEGRLVEWAQEDMNLLDMDSEATDFMVNAEDPAESEDLVDEYIPLSVGMGWKDRLGTRTVQAGPMLPVPNYGSAISW
ncbi:hypothetical protein F5890DRAFT_1599158 [Lentinula detonsa]|uniref:Uncharacterized protein n=1 Tax=Lentinula detonsa TaxID=2804962 RepID=A0AA38UTD6_9AGAR|nr:hypothetical protein F5890DRAFT_1599158 [Lentinula detonsa]